MPRPPKSARLPIELPTPKPTPDADLLPLAFDARYDNLVAKLHQVRVQHEKAVLDFRAARAEREEIKTETQQLLVQNQTLTQQLRELLTKLSIKQRVIALLLPYYPHPITPELRWQLDY